MRIVLLDDDGNAIDGLQLVCSDFTYIRNGSADWLGLTVGARNAVLGFIINAFRQMVPEPIAKPSPANVVKFRKPNAL